MGDIVKEVIFRSVEKREKNSVVRYSHFYHPLANSEDISRMTGTLEVVFWLTKIDQGEEGPGLGRGGVDKTELLRRGKQLGSLVVRSWQP